jgi:hypothetical protein
MRKEGLNCPIRIPTEMKRHRDGDDDGGDDGDVRVRSAEGEVVPWSRSAAARSAALANWVSDTGGAEETFATLVPAAALRTLSRVAEGGAEDGRALEGCSCAQLAQLLHGAHLGPTLGLVRETMQSLQCAPSAMMPTSERDRSRRKHASLPLHSKLCANMTPR